MQHSNQGEIQYSAQQVMEDYSPNKTQNLDNAVNTGTQGNYHRTIDIPNIRILEA